MQIQDVQINDRFIEILKAEGIKTLYPPQDAAILAGVLDGKSLVISTPTASGKTLIAEFGIAQALKKGNSAIYVVPLRALAHEKYMEFKKYEQMGYRVRLEMGDLDSGKYRKDSDFDILVTTAEKLDSILRSRQEWFKNVGILAMDEIHLIAGNRGPVYEIIIAKFNKLFPGLQVLALSATIGNAKELAEWLNAEVIESEWRPVKLSERVETGGKFENIKKIVKESISDGGQVLIFVNSRRSAESVAERLGEELGLSGKKSGLKKRKLGLNGGEVRLNGLEMVGSELKREMLNRNGLKLNRDVLKGNELELNIEVLKGEGLELNREMLRGKGSGLNRDGLKEIAGEILDALPTPTKQCKRLVNCVENGIGFHHAGLLNKQRVLIEDSFRKGRIKVIVATPTLAFGVNLPSRVVVIRDIKRYGAGVFEYVPVLEYKQWVGRAGRPKFDPVGMAIILAKNKEEEEFLVEKYINGEVEPIVSKLGVEPVLRFHILAAIASDFTPTQNAIIEFFRTTFFGHQYGLEGFEHRILNIIDELKNWGFIDEEKGFLIPTRLGKRTSELYIDPQTAHNYISLLKIAESRHEFSSLGLLEMLCDSVEMPLLYVGRKEEGYLWINACKAPLLREVDGFDLDVNFLERFKTAKLLNEWIDEVSEDSILGVYGAGPGILQQRLGIAEWLTYSASEISKILMLESSFKELKKMEMRIKYGIKEELIQLVRIRGIGRVRARKLFNAGFKNIGDLKNADDRKLAEILGSKIAENVRGEIRQH